MPSPKVSYNSLLSVPIVPCALHIAFMAVSWLSLEKSKFKVIYITTFCIILKPSESYLWILDSKL